MYGAEGQEKNCLSRVLSFLDSKTLSEEKREILFKRILKTEWLGWRTEILSPSYLSTNMLKRCVFDVIDIDFHVL